MTTAARHPTPSHLRRSFALLGVLSLEGYTYTRYAAYGAEFHFWLHALLGGTAALTLLAAVRLIRTRRHRRRPEQRRNDPSTSSSALLGHVWSAFPDVLFLGFGVLHASWMDVFGLHITIHFVPAPLPTMLLLWSLALLAHVSLAYDRRGLAVSTTVVIALLLLGAIALRAPVPDSLQDLRPAGATSSPADPRTGAWWCTVASP